MYDPMNINHNENTAGQVPENNTSSNSDSWQSQAAAESASYTEQTPESTSQTSAQANNEQATQPQQPSWQDASTLPRRSRMQQGIQNIAGREMAVIRSLPISNSGRMETITQRRFLPRSRKKNANP